MYYEDNFRVVILEFGLESARKAVLLEFENDYYADTFATTVFSAYPAPVEEQEQKPDGTGDFSRTDPADDFRITLSVRD